MTRDEMIELQSTVWAEQAEQYCAGFGCENDAHPNSCYCEQCEKEL